MTEFWCVRRKILRHQCLCLVVGKFLVKVPQLPAPCTFPSAVWGSSWVLLLPELWACKSIEEEQGLEAVAHLSSVLPPRPYLILLYLSFRSCSELWHKLIPAFHCMLYYFFVLVKKGNLFTCFEYYSFCSPTLWKGVLHVCVSSMILRAGNLET